jgi:hypothetical protein
VNGRVNQSTRHETTLLPIPDPLPIDLFVTTNTCFSTPNTTNYSSTIVKITLTSFLLIYNNMNTPSLFAFLLWLHASVLHVARAEFYYVVFNPSGPVTKVRVSRMLTLSSIHDTSAVRKHHSCPTSTYRHIQREQCAGNLAWLTKFWRSTSEYRRDLGKFCWSKWRRYVLDAAALLLLPVSCKKPEREEDGNVERRPAKNLAPPSEGENISSPSLG